MIGIEGRGSFSIGVSRKVHHVPHIRYALTFSLFCLFLRAEASVRPVQSSSLSTAFEKLA